MQILTWMHSAISTSARDFAASKNWSTLQSNGMDAPTPNGIAVCQSGGVYQPLEQIGASDIKVTTVGIDLAKSVFQLRGVNELGKPVL